MKKLSLLFFVITLISCSQEIKEVKVVEPNQLVEREGLTYEKFSDIPYTGNQISYYENGQLESKGQYVDGKFEGLLFFYDENGDLNQKHTFKNGKWNGLHENYIDGQLLERLNYKNDEYDGPQMYYNNDGNVDRK